MRNWLDIVEALYEGSWNQGLQRFRSPFAFRGDGRAGRGLTSSLLRLANGHADARRLEQSLLRNFRKYGHSAGAPGDSIWNWMALGQHRGLPTRLLDWSYSPLVALHFATEHPEDFETDGVVWCVNFIETNARLPSRLKRMLQRESSDTFTADMLSTFGSVSAFDTLTREPFVVFVEPPAIDERILHQLALFSLISSPSASLDDWLRDRPELYRRVVVPAALKREIRDKLDQANVNERVLFPGLDGLSRWLTRYYTPAAKREQEAHVDEGPPRASRRRVRRVRRRA